MRAQRPGSLPHTDCRISRDPAVRPPPLADPETAWLPYPPLCAVDEKLRALPGCSATRMRAHTRHGPGPRERQLHHQRKRLWHGAGYASGATAASTRPHRPPQGLTACPMPMKPPADAGPSRAKPDRRRTLRALKIRRRRRGGGVFGLKADVVTERGMCRSSAGRASCPGRRCVGDITRPQESRPQQIVTEPAGGRPEQEQATTTDRGPLERREQGARPYGRVPASQSSPDAHGLRHDG